MARDATPTQGKWTNGLPAARREARRAGRGLALFAAFLALPSASPAAAAAQAAPMPAANRSGERASTEARRVGAWVIETGDHEGGPFLIVDKIAARVFAFDGQGLLLASTPALLGLGKGDRSPEGIGTRKLSSISPAERITPAGRFVAALGKNLGGKDILWVDYDAAVSLHRVDTANPAERRLQRLSTPTASDNRISYGCINVPADFYETNVVPLFRGRTGIVYILPEVEPIEDVLFVKESRGLR